MSPKRVTVPLPISGPMSMLTRAEVSALLDASNSGLYELFRRCALAVLNMGSDIDNVNEILERYLDFAVDLIQDHGAIELEIHNPPPEAFVDGEIIVGIQEHLYTVLRDILFVHNQFPDLGQSAELDSAQITDRVFHILRNARVLRPRAESRLVVCWGGHSISRPEYEYTKLVGYELGLRGMDICTGCGPGAMKGPMKGAAIGHAKQRRSGGRYVGITEPGIIAAEAPNPIVNELVITPDIEMRLEAFLRLGHGFVIFPGGVGTAEEFFYILGILLHPDNQGDVFPLILTGPTRAATYFEELDEFVAATLGPEAQRKYQIIIDDPVGAARAINTGVDQARAYRDSHNDAGLLPLAAGHRRRVTTPLHTDPPIHGRPALDRRPSSGRVGSRTSPSLFRYRRRQHQRIRASRHQRSAVRSMRRLAHRCAPGKDAGWLCRPTAHDGQRRRLCAVLPGVSAVNLQAG